MGPSKKKSRLKKQDHPKHNQRPVRELVSPRCEGQTWEDCIGWLACLIIIISPLVFSARIRDFADLPQRTFIQAAVALFCILGLMRVIVLRCRLELPRDICSCALAVFACWALLSVSWSTSSYTAMYSAVHWSACALAVFGFAAWLRSDVWLGRLAGSLVVSGALVSSVALSQLFLGMTRIPSAEIPSAAFANPNVLAEFLCTTIAFAAFAGWFARRRLLLAVLCWFACAAGLLVLYYTHCRSAWLAIACLLLWSVGLLRKRNAGWKLFMPFVVLVLVLVLCLGVYAGVSLTKNPVVRSSFDGSANYRLIVWSNTVELLKQKPVTGYGAGSFSNMYGAVLNVNQEDPSFGKDVQVRRAHNDFLQTAVELGLPGFLLLVFFAGGVLVMALRLMNAQRTELEQFVLFAASGSLVAFLVNAFFGFPFQRAVTPLLAFLSAGMIIALYCRERGTFFYLSRRGALIAAVIVIVVLGTLLLRFNLGRIESDAYYRRALAMENRGQNARALDFGLQAIAARPGRMDVLTTVGRAYITTGRLDEGIAALQTVIKHQPYNLNALFILGVGYANAGRSTEALEIFRRVLDIKPDFVEALPIVSRLKASGRVTVNLK